jgi:GNAT superfamily N-acetyltransferase
MRCIADAELAAFADQVLPYLHRDAVRNNLACTIIESRRRGQVPVEPDATWLRVVDGSGRLVTAALRTPPFPLVLTDAPAAAIDVLVMRLLAAEPDLPRVSGPMEVSREFADRWSAATGRPAAISMAQRMFRLDTVEPPVGVPGRPRAGTPADRERVIDWLAAFGAEALPDHPHSDPAPAADRLLARGDGLWLWEVGGEPVSMLTTAVPAGSVVRINSVYTPPSRRGHGYASAGVAAASQRALDQGAAACTLYTDLANPTSNQIYQAIGYYPVGDATIWRLRDLSMA